MNPEATLPQFELFMPESPVQEDSFSVPLPIPKLKGKDLSHLAKLISEFNQFNKLFCYDRDSGCFWFRPTTTTPPYSKINQEQALDVFVLMWSVNATIQESDERPTKVSKELLALVFSIIKKSITFSSRRQIYNAIKPYDGVPRIQSFMKDYMDCDDNPNFFKLFMTHLVAYLYDPYSEKAYCPFHFDFVGEQGVGKTLLLKHYLSFGYYAQLKPRERDGDMLAPVYEANAIIANDDEGTVVRKDDSNSFTGMSYEQWKDFISNDTDSFRKTYGKTQTLRRNFIVTRTSNDVFNAIDPAGARRQIIFQSNLKKDDCRVPTPKGDPEVYRQFKELIEQLFAEAKFYFEKNNFAPYRLSDEERDLQDQQQLEQFDTDDRTYSQLLNFIKDAIRVLSMPGHSDREFYVLVQAKTPGIFYCGYQLYADWYERKGLPPNYRLSSQKFWLKLKMIERQTGYVEHLNKKVKFYDNGKGEIKKVWMFNLTGKKTTNFVATTKAMEDDLPDLKY